MIQQLSKKLLVMSTSLSLVILPTTVISPAKAITIEEITIQPKETKMLDTYVVESNLIEQHKVLMKAINLKEEILRVERDRFLEIIKSRDLTKINLRTPSGLTYEDLNLLLKGTGLEGLGKGFIEAETNHNVNAYYLVAHAAWESGWGKSNLARDKNNLYGFTAYDGNAYHDAMSFKTKEECINVVAKYISEHYLDEDGKYYNGPTLKGINKRYATDKNWAPGIGEVIKGLAYKIEEQNTNL